MERESWRAGTVSPEEVTHLFPQLFLTQSDLQFEKSECQH